LPNRPNLAFEEIMTPTDPSVLARGEPPRPKAKRVYKNVSTDEKDGQYRVLLDGRPVMTPLRKQVSTPRRKLAEALAAEWDAQNPFIDPEAMPLTRLISTMLDRISPEREVIIEELLRYTDADLLCYRAAFPADLKARQDAVWQPVLDWLAAAHGVRLTAAEGIMPYRQLPETQAALRRAITNLNDENLTVLQAAAAVTSSLALSLALACGRINAADVFAAAALDESYQMEKWGEDDLALQRRRHIEGDLAAIGKYFGLVNLP
jgi:chaperone required for assembly of F1-ATPase